NGLDQLKISPAQPGGNHGGSHADRDPVDVVGRRAGRGTRQAEGRGRRAQRRHRPPRGRDRLRRRHSGRGRRSGGRRRQDVRAGTRDRPYPECTRPGRAERTCDRQDRRRDLWSVRIVPQADRQGTPSGVPAGDAVRDVQAEGGAPVAAPGRRGRVLTVLASLAAVIYVADLATKTIVLETLEGEPPLVVIPGVLQFRVIFNSGAAFSIGTGMTFIFTLIAAGVVAAIIRTARKLVSMPWAITLGLLLGGALGNLTDRLLRYPSGFGRPTQLQGHVVDFVEVLPGNFPVIDYFPVFNVADSAIVCGGILAVILAWRGYQIDGTREGKSDRAAEPAGARRAGGGAARRRALPAVRILTHPRGGADRLRRRAGGRQATGQVRPGARRRLAGRDAP